jgi:hypothetical protein
MKRFMFLLLICLPSVVFSQINDSQKYYLDGKEFKWNHLFISPVNIGSVDVKKDGKNSEIFFKTKDGKWKYKSLETFIKSFSNHKEIYNKSVIPVFIISGLVVDEPDSVRIDDSYYGETIVSKLENVKGIPDQCKNLVIVNISFSDKPVIHLRGNVFPNMDSSEK